MKKNLILLAVVALFLSACGDYVEVKDPIARLMPEIETGDWAQLGKFPYQKYGEMGSSKIKELGLERRVVTTPLSVINYQSKNDRWKLETLESGTLVATDSIGRPWYKISCGNRLYLPVRQVLAPSTAVTPGGGIKSAPAEGSSRWGLLAGLWDFVRNLGETVVGLAVLLLLILVALALLSVAWLIARWLRDRLHQPAVVVPPHPVVPPVAPVGGGGAPAPIVPGPAPNENGAGVFVGPGGVVRVVGRGIDNQSVTIDGQHVTIDVTVRPVP